MRHEAQIHALLVLFVVLFAMPLVVCLPLVLGAACASLWGYINRRTRNTLIVPLSASIESVIENRHSK